MYNFKYLLTILIIALSLNAKQAYSNEVMGTLQIADSELVKTKKSKDFTINKNIRHKYQQIGNASWYGTQFHGRKTACGSVYNQFEYTAAHPSFPMPSVARVTNLKTRHSILVVVNDRGPYVDKSLNRIIDLSRRSAYDLGIINQGVAKVKVEYLHDHTKKLLSQIKKSRATTKSSRSKELIKQVAYLNITNKSRS